MSTLSLGTHVLTAAVTDALGLSGSDARSLTIVANAAPNVSIAAPLDGATVVEGTSVDLIASASDAEDGDLTPTIAWSSSLDGPLGSGGALSLSTLSLGSHVLTAAVTDALGLSGSDARTLTIVANAAPTVSIAAPLDGATVVEGTSVDLIASADDAEDGDLSASITWSSSLDGPLGSGGALSLSTLSLGSHVLTAAVTDALGLSGSDARTLTIVANAAPTVSIAAPLDGATVVEGTSVDLIASADDAEDGDLSASITWSSSLDGPLGSGGALSLSTLSLGTHVLTATVTDALGLSGNDVRTLTIVANDPPAVSIAAPLDGATVVEGTSVDLIASASDPEDGDLTPSITWSSSLDGPLGSGGALSLSTLSLGSHVLTAAVTDALAAVGSAQVTLSIVENASPTLTVYDPSPGAIYAEGDAVPFAATAMDSEDGNLSAAIQWSSNVDGGLGVGSILTRDDLSPGAHTLTASVTDSLRATAIRQTLITIVPNAAPIVTIDTPPNGALVTLGSDVDLNGSAVDAEDGDLSAAIVWLSSGSGYLGTGPHLSIAPSPIGNQTITAIVVDRRGLPDTAQISISVVANAAPTLTITSPPGYVEITAVDPLTLAAMASDAEDGDLSASVRWTSNRDGQLGTGSPLSVDGLSVGLHAITASVTDSLGATRTAQRAVSVPESGTLAGWAAGLIGLAGLARRRRAATSWTPGA
ncbi:MAG: hypothetical protein R3F35_08900 [Myxococcota bacterium]